MPESFKLASSALLSPLTLLFVSGFVLAVRRWDVVVPAFIGKAISTYLLMAIGLKGGVSLAASESLSAILPTAVAAILLSAGLAVLAFAVIRTVGGFDAVNAGAIAAHYGSVSVVTFVTATAFLEQSGIAYDGFMVGVLALMEVPGIIVALLLVSATTSGSTKSMKHVLAESVGNPSVLILLASLTAGYVLQSMEWHSIPTAFNTPFYVFLALFLLDMGFSAGRRFADIRSAGTFLAVFAVGMPVVGAAIGLLTAHMLGLSVGSATLLAVLCGSASYIAAPAAVRMALPEANPGYSLTASLGMTFPFNLIVGIPLYFALAEMIIG